MTRRILACFAAVLMLAMGCAALATPEYDFSDLSIAELYDVRAQLDMLIEEKEAAEGSGYFEDGTYLVGTDLPVGNYAVQENANAMFASVIIRAGDSAEDALIMHKLVSGQVDIHLTRNTWVTFSEVRAWPMGGEPSLVGEDGTVGEGSYLVGAQLEPGSYQVSVADKAPLSSYSVFSGILGSGEQLLKFELLHDRAEITLTKGNYIELSGATMKPLQ